jgi:serine carboxypeptidase-like clade 2
MEVFEQVAGWTISYGENLTFATVRGAAHMVPYAQPARALALFKSFIGARRLPSHEH